MKLLARSRNHLVLLALAAAIVAAGCEGSGAESVSLRARPPGAAAIAPLAVGDRFPVGSYRNLNPVPGGTVDLAQSIGKRPVLLFYWIAGHPRSEELFRRLEAMVQEVGPDRLALYGVAVPRPNIGAEAITARVRELGLRSPVIDDEDFAIGRRLEVAQVPHITILDREGRLRLSNGASLRQAMSGGLSLEAVIRRTAATGEIDEYGKLARYFPVKEMEGRPCPDFRARLLGDSVEHNFAGMIDGRKLNVLIFWSVDCPHCRHSLPEINAWLRQHPDGVNVVSAAKVTSEATKIKTREFCEYNDFVFPTFVDDSNLADLFNITSTPTILIIRPDGVIDTAMVAAEPSFATTIESKRREILGS